MLKRKIEIIVVLLMSICALLAVLFTRSVTSVKLSSEGIYNFYGMDYKIKEGERLSIDDNNVLCIGNGDDLLTLGTLPVYYENENEIMLTSKMAFYKPALSKGFIKKGLSPMIEVKYDADNRTSYFINDNKKKAETSGYLFDGHNTYIILEEMVLTYDNYSYVLPALSYITVEKDNWVGFYNSETKEYTEDYIFEEVIMKDRNNTYRVNLAGDVFLYQNKEYLMSSNMEILSDYFTGE